MEEKIAALAPPKPTYPLMGSRIEQTIVLKGTGQPACGILIRANFLTGEPGGPWKKKTEVKQDGNWEYIVTDPESDAPGTFWFEAKQEQYWPPEISEPSARVEFTKILAPPIITTPRTGGSLDGSIQKIVGTAIRHTYTKPQQVEIELNTVPPSTPFKTTAIPDNVGHFTETTGWDLSPGSYLLKGRTLYDGKASRWSDDIPVTVSDATSNEKQQIPL